MPPPVCLPVTLILRRLLLGAGLWEWEQSTEAAAVEPGQHLKRTILVPFPPESCLSGVRETHQWMLYRLQFDCPPSITASEPVVLRFGAVDWMASVYLNGVHLGNHTGGYAEFHFDLLSLRAAENELIVKVYDPSELGAQPFGKQRAASITAPG
jgi:beta-galactosidase/beta-glucuronidase